MRSNKNNKETRIVANSQSSPTSEVGSEQVLIGTDVSTQAVTEQTSVSANIDSDIKWRSILEQQNQNFLELIRTIQTDVSSNNKENKIILLPKFDPTVEGSDASAWCSTVDLIVNEQPLEGSVLIMSLSHCLLGTAAHWLPSVCYVGIKWEEFKELFIQRFGSVDTPAATILHILKSKPNSHENLSVFSSRLVTLLMTSWQNMNKEEIAVAVVLARVAQINTRLEHEVFTSKITTRQALQQELKAFTYAKRSDGREEGDQGCQEAKRIKLTTTIKCHYCGKIGHKIADCRLRSPVNKEGPKFVNTSKNNNQIICYKCKQQGHIATRCSWKEGGHDKKGYPTKDINICCVDPVGSIEHNEQQIQTKIEEKHIHLTEISYGWLQAEQRRDPEMQQIIQRIENNEADNNEYLTYEIRKGILHRKIQRKGKTLCLPIIPRTFRWSVINNVHESVLHLGWEKTLDKLYDHFWFENMAKYVRKFVNNCMTCNISKPHSGKVSIELHPIPKVSEPWHTVHLDITGKLSGKNEKKEYIIVLVDAFTKYVLLHHTTNINSSNCIKSLQSAISIFGVPSRVIADQGRCFAGKEFVEFCNTQNIKLHLIATSTSRANGQVERIMSTLKNMLIAVETSKRAWQEALGEIQLAMNCTTNRVTQASPLELLIGKIARPFGLLDLENEKTVNLDQIRANAAKSIERSAQYDKNRFDSNKAKIVRFKIGDFVLLKIEERHKTKLEPKYKGPFRVVKLLENDRYELESLNTKRKYKYAHENIRMLPLAEVPEGLGFESSDEDEGGAVKRDGSLEIVERDGVNSIETVERDGVEFSQTVARDGVVGDI